MIEFKNKQAVDELVARALQANTHALRTILFEVFMAGVVYAKDRQETQLRGLRKKCFMKAANLFDLATPEDEHERRVGKHL